MTKKEFRECQIKQRMWLFEQYCKDQITLEEYSKRMSEIDIEAE